MTFDLDIVLSTLPLMLQGLVLTLEVAILGMAVAVVIGLLVALAGIARYRVLVAVSTVWVAVMRGVPLLVFLYWIYYSLTQLTGIGLDSLTAAVLALGFTGSAYMAEVFRSGLRAVDPGQWEASAALGLPTATTFGRVVLPQALRYVIAPSINVFVGLLKGATIVSVIGVADMIYVAKKVSQQTFTPFELYSTAGVILIAVTALVALGGLVAERRLQRGVRHG